MTIRAPCKSTYLIRLANSKELIEIEVVSFDNSAQLDAVIKSSKVCISVVLYWQVGEVVVKSCVENGTDYIDV